MFQSIQFIGSDKKKGICQITYQINDSNFISEITVPISQYIYDSRGDASIIPSGLIYYYEAQNLDVAKNLALFYDYSLGRIPSYVQRDQVNIDKEWTDKYFPNMRFGKRYFQCVLNQLDALRYRQNA